MLVTGEDDTVAIPDAAERFEELLSRYVNYEITLRLHYCQDIVKDKIIAWN